MSQPSLLFSSHIDLQRRPMSVSTSSPAYHAPASPNGWWNHHNASFIQQSRQGSHPAPSIYHGTQMDSPYTHSPQINVDLPILPYSPSFSPLQSRSPDTKFPFSGQHLVTKHWNGGRVEPEIYEAPSMQPSPGWPLLSIEPFDSDSWNEMIMTALEAEAIPSPASSQYTLPSPSSLRYLLPCPSPSPSASSSGRLSPISSTVSSTSPSTSSSTPHSRASVPRAKVCSHCAATTTPLWRRDPTTHLPLCNACGLYLGQRNKMRPAALIAADQRDDDDDFGAAPGAPECSHCHTHRTSVWRRSKTGAKLCNACGVFLRLRGRDRPLHLRRNKIRPRCKHPK
ncbi:hypothetical protein DFH09DRAFT_997568 [Mycena vulgaris]|nr:hypothetical protein DFH09DRAFT_997568 [Mycena vulgaris]